MQPLLLTPVRGQARTDDAAALSALDLLAAPVELGGIYFFKKYPDIPRLKRALAKTLDVFPSFGSSMVKEDGRFYLHRNNTGVLLALDESRDAPEPEIDGPFASHGSGLDFNGKNDLTQDGEVFLNVFRLTRYRNNYWSLTFRNVTGLTDAAAISDFMYVWSSFYNDRPVFRSGDYARARIAGLALDDGIASGTRLHCRDYPPALGGPDTGDSNRFSATHVELPTVVLKQVVDLIRSEAHLPLTSADVLSALIWQAFAWSISADAETPVQLYSACDLRRVRDLGIPPDYDGNAVCERRAELSFGRVRHSELAELAADVNRQIKPITAHKLRQDIAGLKRRAPLDSDVITHWQTASSSDCMAGNGIYVNDMRLLNLADIKFEDSATWYDLFPQPGFTYAGIYQTNNWSVSIHYFGRRETVATFADYLSDAFFNLT